MGLVEKEWLETLATINPEEVTYTDYVLAGRMLGRELKEKGCDYVIALTHMRTQNDVRSADLMALNGSLLGLGIFSGCPIRLKLDRMSCKKWS